LVISSRMLWRSCRRPLLLTALLALLAGLAPALNTWAIGGLINALATDERWEHSTTALALAAVAVAALMQRLIPIQQMLVERELRRATSLAWHTALLERINGLPGLAPFEDPAVLDRLHALSDSDESPAQMFTTAAGLAQQGTTVIGVIAVLIGYSPLAALLVLIAALPEVLGEWRLAGLYAKNFKELARFRRRAESFSRLLIDARTVKEVRVFGAHRSIAARSLSYRTSLNGSERAVDRKSVVLRSALAIVGTATAMLALVVAYAGVGTGPQGPGSVAVVLASIVAMQSAMGMLAVGVGELAVFAAPIGWFAQLAEDGRESATAAGVAGKHPALEPTIEFRDVWFRHAEDAPWILRGVNFSVEVGDRIAIVGANGAGKTTLIKLLCGLYRPTQGRITIGGVDTAELDSAALARTLSVVFQDFSGYELTAAENIALRDLGEELSRAPIHAAAERAGVAETLAGLPHGFDTLLSRQLDDDDRATTTLSGGLWQRIALARAFYARPRLMVFDEPSSALDTAGERLLTKRIAELGPEVTTLVVTHRAAAAEAADRVVVLVDGEVEAVGSPCELRSGSPTYRNFLGIAPTGGDDPTTLREASYT
jgi:ATP-binding cassette subfamily B protein